ncbi:MAG: phosphate signaling complex protein PhoU [Candidatus Electryonea clarkiae]|nr:phosphate signaling complex protein PhoU [Candidatus Electryonea clarkiae]MDP8288308.1 phosphate signaling complex protein PhoU [Candidatus Electryonea clarkiae]
MDSHLQREIQRLKKRILEMSARVEESVQHAIRAIALDDKKLAKNVISSDDQIDEMEVEIEEECLKILALHQPVAIDLRFIVAVLKINNELERIGDQAVNIAESALVMTELPSFDFSFDLIGMAEKSRLMLHKSLDALVNLDPTLAREVCACDDEVDQNLVEAYEVVSDSLKKRQSNPDFAIRFVSIARQLERIADLATNIAEDVIYLVEGEIVRHRMKI